MKRRHHPHSPEETGKDGLGLKKVQPPQRAWCWICSAGASRDGGDISGAAVPCAEGWGLHPWACSVSIIFSAF